MCHSRQNIGSGRVCWWWPQTNILFWSYSCLQTYRELGAHLFSPALVVCHSRQNIGSGHLWWWPSLQWGWWHGWPWTFPVHQGGMGWTALTWGWESLSRGGRGCWRWGCSILWCYCLWQLNPQTGAWPAHGTHLPSPSSTTQRAGNFLQGTFYKNLDLKVKKHTYPWSVPHYGPTGCRQLSTAVDIENPTPTTAFIFHHGPTGSWKLFTNMDERSPHYPPSLYPIRILQADESFPQPWRKGALHHPISVWDSPRNKCWDWWIHRMFLLVCAVILGKYSGTLPFAQVNLNILVKIDMLPDRPPLWQQGLTLW